MKTKTLMLSAVLVAASVAVAPVQAHDDYWPLYGLTGLLLIDAITDDHHHHKHRYYDDHRYRYERRRSHSHGSYAGPRYRSHRVIPRHDKLNFKERRYLKHRD